MVLGRVCSVDAGCHLLHLRLGDELLGASPYRLHVTPAAAYAPACLLTADAAALREARPGAPVCVRLLPRDRYGNARPLAEEELHVFVHGAARPLAQQMRCVGVECHITLQLPLSGEYEVSVRVRKVSMCMCMCMCMCACTNLHRACSSTCTCVRVRVRVCAHAYCTCPCACACIHSPRRTWRARRSSSPLLHRRGLLLCRGRLSPWPSPPPRPSPRPRLSHRRGPTPARVRHIPA